MSSTKKTAPELYPLTLEGKLQWVKRGQYISQCAIQQTILLSSEVTKAHITEMLDQAEKGTTEMQPEAPKEMHETFQRVLKDYATAVENVEEEARKAAEAKAVEEKKEAEKKAKEEKLFVDTKGTTSDFGTLSKMFDTGENLDRFVAKKEVDDKTLLSAFNTAIRMGEFNNWMLGDLGNALESRGLAGVVTKICEELGKPYSNVYNAMKTCKAVPPDKRSKGVSYTIFAELANGKYSAKPEEHKAKMIELIDQAAAGKIANSQDARKLKNAAAGKEDPKKIAPEENPKAQFIIIDHENKLAETTVGFPKALFEGGATILDIRNGKMFTSFRSKPENRWSDLPIYKPAEAPPGEGEPEKKKGKKKK